MDYHFVKQENWNDCGLACLVMLIEKYHHQRISIYELKENLNSTWENGLSFFNLVTLGKKYQLIGEGFNCEIEMLVENTHRLPFILNVKNEQGADHYVILNKIDQGYYFINDPSQNKPLLKLNFEQLKAIFLNKILIFKKNGKLKSPISFKILKNLFFKYQFALFLLSFLTIIANFCWMISASYIKIFSNWVLKGQINWWQFFEFVFYLLWGCLFDLLEEKFSLKLYQKTWIQLEQNFLKQKLELGIRERILERNFYSLKETLDFLQLFWTLIIKTLVILILIPILELWISQINLLFCFLPLIFNLIIIFAKIVVTPKIKWKKDERNFKKQIYTSSVNNYLNNQILINNRGLKNVFIKNINTQSKKFQKINSVINFQTSIINFWEKFFFKLFYFVLLVIVFYSLNKQMFNYENLLYLIIISNLLLKELMQWTNVILDFYFNRQNIKFLNQFDIFKKKILSTKLVKVENFKLENLELISHDQTCLINQVFTSSFFVHGNEQLINSFYQAIIEFKLSNEKIKINNQDFKIFQDDFFILNQTTDLIPGTILENVFNWNQNLDPHLFSELKPLFWLEKYQVNFLENDWKKQLNLQQKQLINFLAAFFSEQPIFIFNNCLNELNQEDEKELVKLFCWLKPNVFIILSSNNLNLESSFKQKLVLNPMI